MMEVLILDTLRSNRMWNSVKGVYYGVIGRRDIHVTLFEIWTALRVMHQAGLIERKDGTPGGYWRAVL